MGLLDKIFKPKYNFDYPDKARLADAERIKDQETLIEIARKDPNEKIRRIVVSKIKDSEVLAELAKSEEKKYVRQTIVLNPHLKDESVLADIAKNDLFKEVRENAVRNPNLKDENLLTDIALNDSNGYVCRQAVDKIKNQNLLASIAKKNTRTGEAYEALKKIDDQSLLIDIAKSNANITIREGAASRITDKSVLADVALNDSDSYVRQRTLENITDMSVLVNAAKNDPDSSVRKSAIKRISDEEILIDIAKNDPDSYVKKTALAKITDRTAIGHVALNDSDSSVRQDAFKRLREIPFEKEDIETLKSKYHYNDDLEEFEKLNQTTPSIYDLEFYEVLIIDSNGNNYTSWQEYHKMIEKKKSDISYQIDKDERIHPWASGRDSHYHDGINFISENYKIKHSSPGYTPQCSYIGYGLFLNPTTDSRTEKEKYYLHQFENVRAIVVNDLSEPSSMANKFNNCTAKTISFNNCNIGKEKEDELFKSCKNLKEIIN